jgi:gas vesicle protein
MKTSLIFLLGIGMGTVIGILIAPEAGKITRRKIRDEADRLIDEKIRKRQQHLTSQPPDVTIHTTDSGVVTESRYTL